MIQRDIVCTPRGQRKSCHDCEASVITACADAESHLEGALATAGSGACHDGQPTRRSDTINDDHCEAGVI
jgi:hypothetical protein